LQKQYGKTSQELETLVEGFCWILADYPMPVILAALAEYVRREPDIPAPADLVRIINPPQPELSAAVYVQLKQRVSEGGWLFADEREYCRAFESRELAKAGWGAEGYPGITRPRITAGTI
jgi:hypothetical protein